MFEPTPSSQLGIRRIRNLAGNLLVNYSSACPSVVSGIGRVDMQAVRHVAGSFISRLRRFSRNTPRIGLALGGGFARGIAHAGVLKIFENTKFPFTVSLA